MQNLENIYNVKLRTWPTLIFNLSKGYNTIAPTQLQNNIMRKQKLPVGWISITSTGI